MLAKRSSLWEKEVRLFENKYSSFGKYCYQQLKLKKTFCFKPGLNSCSSTFDETVATVIDITFLRKVALEVKLYLRGVHQFRDLPHFIEVV